ncbi:MAG: hypothetical protein CR986_09930 [Ignavibacteriae bacterium]|nr:MAG: hypothetical protein CR986_09930 [Ignavibacteriota bacterium]
MKNLKYFFLFIFLTFSILSAQAVYTDEDVEICNSKFQLAVDNNLSTKPINEVIVEIGKSFLGVDYVAHSLEKDGDEKLVVFLTGLDCYLFFESSLTFARCIKQGKITFEDFQNELRKTRYRNGIINGYPSRLHYASDWLYDNAKRGIVKDVTKEIGGISYIKKIDFMSTHPKSYKQLKGNEKFVEDIKVVEDSINGRNYYYIPQNFIDCVEDKILNGDIILLTTNINGLDIAHTGIAIKMDDGRIHFMHAPLIGAKVQISEKPLGDYVKSIKKQTGIMVARVLEP